MAVKSEAVAQVAESASGAWAGKLSAGTSFSLFGFGVVTWNDIAMIGGLLLGAGTFAVNWYYRHQEFKLKRESHRASLLPAEANDAG
jgi:hypothetical protein